MGTKCPAVGAPSETAVGMEKRPPSRREAAFFLPLVGAASPHVNAGRRRDLRESGPARFRSSPNAPGSRTSRGGLVRPRGDRTTRSTSPPAKASRGPGARRNEASSPVADRVNRSAPLLAASRRLAGRLGPAVTAGPHKRPAVAPHAASPGPVPPRTPQVDPERPRHVVLTASSHGVHVPQASSFRVPESCAATLRARPPSPPRRREGSPFRDARSGRR
jgi:hypothetical protein